MEGTLPYRALVSFYPIFSKGKFAILPGNHGNNQPYYFTSYAASIFLGFTTLLNLITRDPNWESYESLVRDYSTGMDNNRLLNNLSKLSDLPWILPPSPRISSMLEGKKKSRVDNRYWQLIAYRRVFVSVCGAVPVLVLPPLRLQCLQI